MASKYAPKGGIPIESALYAVICRDDTTDNMQSKGPYALATRQLFATEREAEDYADGLSLSRDPVIVVGDWADAVALGTHFGSNTINRFVKVIRSPSPGMRIPGFGALRGRDLAPDSADLRIPLVYSALRLPGATRTPLGARDCNGATLYPGDWLRDVHTGFVMRAATNDDARGLLLSIDLTHCIEPERAVLYTPDPATKVGKIAECDQGAHADAVAKRHVPAPAQGPSVFENLDEWI